MSSFRSEEKPESARRRTATLVERLLERLRAGPARTAELNARFGQNNWSREILGLVRDGIVRRCRVPIAAGSRVLTSEFSLGDQGYVKRTTAQRIREERLRHRALLAETLALLRRQPVVDPSLNRLAEKLDTELTKLLRID